MNFHVEHQGYLIRELFIPYRERLGKKKLGMKHAFPILQRIVITSLQKRFQAIPQKDNSHSRKTA